MTPTNNLTEALAGWQPAGTGRHNWSHSLPADGWTLHLLADRSDSVGSVGWEMSLSRTGPAPSGATTRAWADRIAARVTGLLEPLHVIEVDDAGAEAILRSGTPSKRGMTVEYYELRLTGTQSAELRRYQADPKAGTPRTQIGFTLTHEVLAKLIEDVVRD